MPGSPFLCRVRDGDCGSVGEADYSEGGHVTVELEHLASIAVAQPAEFTIRVPEVKAILWSIFHFSDILTWLVKGKGYLMITLSQQG